MKIRRLVVLLFIAPTLALGVERTVDLSVPGMTCPVCPITIKKSLEKVDGVKAVHVEYENKTTRVVYDDEATTVQRLLSATAQAGYPAQVKEGE